MKLSTRCLYSLSIRYMYDHQSTSHNVMTWLPSVILLKILLLEILIVKLCYSSLKTTTWFYTIVLCTSYIVSMNNSTSHQICDVCFKCVVGVHERDVEAHGRDDERLRVVVHCKHNSITYMKHGIAVPVHVLCFRSLPIMVDANTYYMSLHVNAMERNNC